MTLEQHDITFYDYLIKRLKEKGLNRYKMARELEIAYQSIYNYRKAAPRKVTYIAIAYYLDVDPKFLMSLPITLESEKA